MSRDLTVQRDLPGGRDTRLRSRALWRVGLPALCVVALLAFTLQSLRLSDASLTAASSNTSNVFIAGTLAHVNDQNGKVVLSAAGMAPGDTLSGTMILTGAGNVPGTYTLSPLSVVDMPETPPLSGVLTVAVEETTGGVDVLLDEDYAGDLADIPLGTLSPGQVRSFRITLEYPDGPAVGELQGATTTMVLQVSGVSQ
jgi:hypothetical protein